MIQEVTHEADEIRRNITELYDSNRLKQGMGEQARYFTPEQLEGIAGMRKLATQSKQFVDPFERYVQRTDRS